MTAGEKIVYGILALIACVHFGLTVQLESGQVFDDSFISFRYSRHLVEGHGLVWNVGEAPTEGYTNFLWVVLIAPFLALGCDPFLVARLLSLAAALALWFWLGRDLAAKGVALWLGLALASSLFLLRTPFVAMLGLETVPYGLALFACFRLGLRWLEEGGLASYRLDLGFGLALFGLHWLRPEGLLLVPIFGLATLARREAWTRLVRRAAFLGLGLGLPLALSLAWRWFYFNALLPNPYYLKVGAPAGWTDRGSLSVTDFGEWAWLLLILAVVGCFWPDADRSARRLALATVILFCLFFNRVDTTMDNHGRFLWPLLPILCWAGLPMLLALAEAARRIRFGRVGALLVALAVMFGLMAVPAPILIAQTSYLIHGGEAFSKTDLMIVERDLALRLANYPRIRETLIAFADAGTVPYFTRARHLDLVGLNDSFIARERDPERLVDYVFDRRPDLMILPSIRARHWIPFGHGPLGNYRSWTTDPRFDEYFYVGTVKTNFYYLHFVLDRRAVNGPEFAQFLNDHVLDGRYEPFPLPLGSRPGLKDTLWLAGPRG